jgi:N-acetylmuramoyl-L-alanine amidase
LIRRRTTTTALCALTATVALLAGATTGSASSPTTRSGTRVGEVNAAHLRPVIVQRPIKFGPRRKAQMARYSLRHYGHRSWRLRRPRVIVEHYTDGGTFAGAWATMAADTRNLGELPGVCAHFVVDTDGTIYQVVPLRIRCRHTIGLNQTAIGIEHVGTSSVGVLNNSRQRRASMRLTLWLMARFGISVGNVIGHGESLMSPLRHERYRSWRCMTHTDFSHPAMRRYRHLLRRQARLHHVPVGPPPHWVDIGC